MAQQLPTDYPIDPTVTSGTALADILNRSDEVFNSTNSGPTRPATIKTGGLWAKTGGAALELFMFDGTTDIPIQSGDFGVSTDAGNITTLGTDGLVMTDGTALDSKYVKIAGDTMTGTLIGAFKVEHSSGTFSPIVTAGLDHFTVRPSEPKSNFSPHMVQYNIFPAAGSNEIIVTYPLAFGSAPRPSITIDQKFTGTTAVTCWVNTVKRETMIVDRRRFDASSIMASSDGFYWTCTGRVGDIETAQARTISDPITMVSYWADEDKSWIFCLCPESTDILVPVTTAGDYSAVVTHAPDGCYEGILAFGEPRDFALLSAETTSTTKAITLSAEERLKNTGFTLQTLKTFLGVAP